jgi:hypothetical protein
MVVEMKDESCRRLTTSLLKWTTRRERECRCLKAHRISLMGATRPLDRGKPLPQTSLDNYLPYEDENDYGEDLDGWWDHQEDNDFEDWTGNPSPNSQ